MLVRIASRSTSRRWLKGTYLDWHPTGNARSPLVGPYLLNHDWHRPYTNVLARSSHRPQAMAEMASSRNRKEMTKPRRHRRLDTCFILRRLRAPHSLLSIRQQSTLHRRFYATSGNGGGPIPVAGLFVLRPYPSRVSPQSSAPQSEMVRRDNIQHWHEISILFA